MTFARIAWFLSFAALFAGCGPSESMRRVQNLTAADCLRIQMIVAELSATLPVPNPSDYNAFENLLFGDKIPRQLEYLKPQAVRLWKDYAMIYLYKTPAGEDSIEVFLSEGAWTIKTHIGSWRNHSKEIWSSKEQPNKAPKSTPGSAAPPVAQEPPP